MGNIGTARGIYQHFSSQENAAKLSGPAAIWHCSEQALHAVNFGSKTSVQLPPPVSQLAYFRHLSPIWYRAVHICGAFVPQERSRPWQVVNPQVDGPGVSTVTVVGMVVGVVDGTGVGVTFPPDVRVQPAVMSTAISKRPHIPEIMAGCFMNNHICRDIRRGVYLWVYFAAKILGVMVMSGVISPLTPRYWRGFFGTGIIFHGAT
jgi:hypothetical protein